ncbi:MAG: NifB/NifX family molybdenum-iron cluster-binding protein [Bacteroidales bacterium]|nr:NifB/NifX family molybdenum-iron cluster-binding protein [Bacteroidales bacterium]
MIVAIPSSTDKKDTLIDDRFARCAFFCFYNTETKDIQFIVNNFKNATEGVGPQVVEFLAGKGISAVYASEVGPKAQKILDKLNIRTTITGKKQTIQQIINQLDN